MAEGRKLLSTELRVVNVGLELFANDLRSLGVPGSSGRLAPARRR